MGILVVLPVVLSALLLLPGIQTRVVKVITNRLSSDFNAEISIQRVQISPFSGVQLEGFLVRDQLRDTLFFTEKVRAGIEAFSFRKKHLYIGKVRFQSPVIHIAQYGERMNYAFLLDSLGTPASDSVKWDYSLKGLLISGGKISFEHSILKNPGSIKEKLDFYDLELDLVRTSAISEPLAFKVNNFSVKEDIGLYIKDLSARCSFEEERIVVNDLVFRTNESFFNFGNIEIPVNRNTDSASDYQFRGEIREIAIAASDVRKVFSGFPELRYPVRLSGLLFGSLDNLKGRKVSCMFGEQSRLVTSFDISGLSNFNEAFVFLDVEDLQTNIPDIEDLIAGGDRQGSVLPASFRQLGTIRYKGNFTGFINDLVAYGTFRTNLGTINTDLGLKILPNENLIYGGLLRTNNFNLGKMLDLDPEMGKITLDMEVSGNRKSSTDYFVFLDGNIGAMEVNEYLYRNIELKGLLTHQRFDGSVVIDDPNGKLNFNGKVDMAQKVPHFNFSAQLANVQLDRLKLLPELKDGVFSLNIETNFEGDNLDDLVGEIKLSEGLLFTPNASVDLDSLSIRAVRDGNKKHLILRSNFAEGELTGHYYFGNFNSTFRNYVGHFIPSFNHAIKKLPVGGYNDFEFELRIKEIRKLMAVLFPDMNVSDRGIIKGNFNSELARLNLEGELDYFSFKNVTTNEPEFRISSQNGNQLTLTLRASHATYGKLVELPNFSIHQRASRDTVQTNIFWNNWNEVTNSGALYTTTCFKTDASGNLETKLNLHPSSIIVADMLWKLDEARAHIFPAGFSIHGFKLGHQEQYVTLNGLLHREEEDGLRMVFHELDLSMFLNDLGEDLSFAGKVNGNLLLRDFYREPLLSSNLEIDGFVFNGAPMGTFRVNSLWNQDLEALTVTTLLSNNGRDQLRGFGLFHPSQQHLDFQFDVDSLNIAFLNPFLENVLQNLSGSASGKMYFKGPLSHPFLTGRVKLNDGKFFVDLLQTSYALTDSVVFYPNEMRFKDMTLTDRNGRTGKFRGSVYHDGFSDMIYNLRVDINNMLVLNTKLKDNPYYYGTVFGTGFMLLTGNNSNVNIAINGRTRPNSQFFIPIQDNEEAAESSFIRFSSGSSSKQSGVVKQQYTVDMTGAKVDMDIEVTQDAQVQIIFDARLGDVLRSTGAGNIQIRIDRQGNVRFYGDYTIEEGDYLFSLQNLINKRFTINQGGTVKWQGDPYNALIDITAVYKVRASLSDLLGSMSTNGGSESSDMYRRIPVHCNLMLSDMLQQPMIKFGLETPTLDESRESLILEYISSEEELNRQVLSLLILNKFYTPEYLRAADNNTGRNENTALVTTTEMLSSQISRWFSTISNDVDVGVAYRPGDNITSEEFELALSTQVFNNRVTINGNVGYGKYQTNTSKMVGDFDVDVKLNRTGTIRARAYTRSNDDLIYETSPTTQGIGLSFKEEFNNFKELLRKYRNMLVGRKEKDDEE